MGYYVYKYEDVNKKPVYIGRTTDLERRIKKEHMVDKLKDFKGNVYYFECPNKTAMISYEYALINKYHPKYNDALKDPTINTNIDEPEWILYMSTINQVTSPSIIDISQYFNRAQRVTKQTHLEKSIPSSYTTVISGSREVTFRCQHCGAVFKTTAWSRTKGRHYSAKCPCCPYSAWAK